MAFKKLLIGTSVVLAMTQVVQASAPVESSATLLARAKAARMAHSGMSSSMTHSGSTNSSTITLTATPGTTPAATPLRLTTLTRTPADTPAAPATSAPAASAPATPAPAAPTTAAPATIDAATIDLRTQLRTSQEDYNRVNAELAATLDSARTTRATAGAAQAQVRQLTQQIATIQGEIATVRAALSAKEQAYDTLNSNFHTLNSNFTALGEAFTDTEARLTSTEGALTSVRARALPEAEFAALQTLLGALPEDRRNVAGLVSHSVSLEARSGLLNDEIDDLKNDLQQERNNLEIVTRERDGVRASISAMNALLKPSEYKDFLALQAAFAKNNQDPATIRAADILRNVERIRSERDEARARAFSYDQISAINAAAGRPMTMVELCAFFVRELAKIVAPLPASTTTTTSTAMIPLTPSGQLMIMSAPVTGATGGASTTTAPATAPVSSTSSSTSDEVDVKPTNLRKAFDTVAQTATTVSSAIASSTSALLISAGERLVLETNADGSLTTPQKKKTDEIAANPLSL